MGVSKIAFEALCQFSFLACALQGKRRYVHMLRYAFHGFFHPIALTRWAKAAIDSHGLRSWMEDNPRLLLKPIRPYINRNYDFPSRVEAILAHYGLLTGLFSLSVQDTLRKGIALPLATYQGNRGGCYELTLRRTDQFDREGELVLELVETGARCSVYSCVFSFDSTPGGTVLVIGCIQGPRGGDGKGLIRTATREFHGIRPKNLVIDTLYALNSVWNARALLGVSNGSRIYGGRKTRADYDAFWEEVGGVAADGGLYRLPPHPHHHRLEDVARHHRSEYRKRIHVREELARQTAITAQSWRPFPTTATFVGDAPVLQTANLPA